MILEASPQTPEPQLATNGALISNVWNDCVSPRKVKVTGINVFAGQNPTARRILSVSAGRSSVTRSGFFGFGVAARDGTEAPLTLVSWIVP